MDTVTAALSRETEPVSTVSTAAAAEPWQDIGLRIREAREMRKLPRRDLAAALGVTEGAVQQWEDGRGAMELRRLGPIAIELDVSTDYLIFGAGRPPRPTTANEEAAARLLRRLPEDQQRVAITFLQTLVGARAARRRRK